MQVAGDGNELTVTDQVCEVVVEDVRLAVASQPAPNVTVVGPGFTPSVTLNGVPTAALVGCDVMVNVCGMKLAETTQAAVTGPVV